MKHEAFFRSEPGSRPLSVFRGSQLARGEPDCSSFPNGGLRGTHAVRSPCGICSRPSTWQPTHGQARGYTVWDPNSLPFVLDHGNGLTLYLPSIFLTWTGSHDSTHTSFQATLLTRSSRSSAALLLFRSLYLHCLPLRATHATPTCSPRAGWSRSSS